LNYSLLTQIWIP